jgi:hypothetical protein
MTKKTASKRRLPSSVLTVAEEIIDPEELRAAEESSRARARRKIVVKLSRSLPEQERLTVLMRVIAQIADEDQYQLLDDLLGYAPVEIIKTLEDELVAQGYGPVPAASASRSR